MKVFLCLLLAQFSMFANAEAPANAYDLPDIVAVQNRAYTVQRDLSLQAGYLPSDAFNKGYTIGASYTHFFTSYLGWEVINANYSFNDPTDLKEDLLDCCELQVQNNGFDGALDYVQWYALTNIVYTPLYTKALLFNQSLVYGEISFVGGAGVAKFKETGERLLVSAGFYLRYFKSAERSWKFEFRDNVYFEKSLGAVNAMSLMISYSFHLGGKS